jgi:zinc/manganese transport system substrate-binding protein
VAIVLATVAIAGCASEAQDPEGLTIVATTSIVGDIASNVGGTEASVEVLMPVGVDAHDFQPSASQVTRLHEADLVVANGLGLEAGLEDVLAQAEEDGARVLRLAPLVDPIPFEGHAGHDEPGHEGEGHDEGLDPHFWMDPIRVGRAATFLATELEEVAPGGTWADNAAGFSGRLAEADLEIAALLETVAPANRLLVTNHDVLGYLADRYGWEVIGTVIPGGSTLGAPSSAELAELVAVVDQTGVRAIFTDSTSPGDLAEAVAAEVGRQVEVVALFTESLGPPGSGADTLIGMLLTNAGLIAGASTGAG